MKRKQTATMEAEPEDASDVRRKVSPADPHEAVIYGCSGEWVSLQQIVNGFDSALERFEYGLDDPQGGGGDVITEVYKYLRQLAYALERVYSRGPGVNIPAELHSRILTVTQEIDCRLNKEMGFHTGWSVDTFVDMAADLILLCVKGGKVDVGEIVREWRLARLNESADAVRAARVKLARTLGKGLAQAFGKPAKVSRGKAGCKKGK